MFKLQTSFKSLKETVKDRIDANWGLDSGIFFDLRDDWGLGVD